MEDAHQVAMLSNADRYWQKGHVSSYPCINQFDKHFLIGEDVKYEYRYQILIPRWSARPLI